MRNIEEIMTIVHTANNHALTTTLEELHIRRAATLPNILNDIISENDLLLKYFLSFTVAVNTEYPEHQQEILILRITKSY